jgi:hypothetical protein
MWINKLQGDDEIIMFDNMNEAYIYAQNFIENSKQKDVVICNTICDIMKDILKNEFPSYLLWSVFSSLSYKIHIGIGEGLPKDISDNYLVTNEYILNTDEVKMNQVTLLMNKVSIH